MAFRWDWEGQAAKAVVTDCYLCDSPANSVQLGLMVTGSKAYGGRGIVDSRLPNFFFGYLFQSWASQIVELHTSANGKKAKTNAICWNLELIRSLASHFILNLDIGTLNDTPRKMVDLQNIGAGIIHNLLAV